MASLRTKVELYLNDPVSVIIAQYSALATLIGYSL